MWYIGNSKRSEQVKKRIKEMIVNDYNEGETDFITLAKRYKVSLMFVRDTLVDNVHAMYKEATKELYSVETA